MARSEKIRSAMVLLLLGVVAGTYLVASGCSTPDAGAHTDAIGPDRTQFAYVAPVLVRRCGSIDCHGSKYRNMRIYGYGSERLPGAALNPESPPVVTGEEGDATYASVVGLEPEIMAAVVSSHGVGPERLTFVRKGRGDEDHKGDRRITPGDSSDRCITSWLAGNVDEAACRAGGCLVPGTPITGLTIGSCP
jgi:hypothetical protein